MSSSLNNILEDLLSIVSGVAYMKKCNESLLKNIDDKTTASISSVSENMDAKISSAYSSKITVDANATKISDNLNAIDSELTKLQISLSTKIDGCKSMLKSLNDLKNSNTLLYYKDIFSSMTAFDYPKSLNDLSDVKDNYDILVPSSEVENMFNNVKEKLSNIRFYDVNNELVKLSELSALLTDEFGTSLRWRGRYDSSTDFSNPIEGDTIYNNVISSLMIYHNNSWFDLNKDYDFTDNLNELNSKDVELNEISSKIDLLSAKVSVISMTTDSRITNNFSNEKQKIDTISIDFNNENIQIFENVNEDYAIESIAPPSSYTDGYMYESDLWVVMTKPCRMTSNDEHIQIVKNYSDGTFGSDRRIAKFKCRTFKDILNEWNYHIMYDGYVDISNEWEIFKNE